MIERIFRASDQRASLHPTSIHSHLWGQFMVHAFLYADFRQNFAQASAQDSLYFF